MRNILVSIVFFFGSIHANVPLEMTELIDETVQPCDNYYKYACGKWLKLHKDSATKVDWSMDKIEENRRKILDKVVKDKHKQLRYVWDSCISLSDRKRDGILGKSTDPGVEALLHDLERVSQADTHRDIMKLAGEVSRSRTFAFFEHSVQVGGEDYDSYRLYMRPAKLMLASHDMQHHENPHYQYIEGLFKVAFKDHVHLSNRLYVTKNKMCGYNVCKEVAPDHVIEMEKKLHNLKSQNKDNTKVFERDYATLRWPNTIGAYFEGMGSNKISHTVEIYFEDMDYFIKLDMMIRNYKMNELKPFLAFALIHSRAPWLGDDFVRVWDDRIRSTTKVVDRHQFCQDRLVELLPSLVGSSFTKLAFDTSRRKDAKDMVDLVRESMETHILKSTWPIEDFDQAKTKLSMLKTIIAEPAVTAKFTMDLYRDNYYKNVKNILEYTYYHDLGKVSRRVERDTWLQSSAIAETKYDARMNSVMFPSAMLQPPYFQRTQGHPARDFGAMGTIMGREISHGFDKTGSQYGNLGNKHEWWSEAMKTNFNEVMKCMTEQYSSFEGHGHNTDADEKHDQNLADSRGLAVSWEAYKKYMASHNNQDPSKTSQVTATEGEKLFFLAFAQSMCTHIPQGRESNAYTLPEWRVNGALMNLDQFHTVYGCSASQKMVPNRKCDVW